MKQIQVVGSERYSNPRPLDCESDALTTRPRCVLWIAIPKHSALLIDTWTHTQKHAHRRNAAYHVSQGSALTAPLGYVTFRYKQEHWLFSTHTLPSNHFPSGQWQPSVQGELHFALSLLIFRHVRGHDEPHSLYSNPAGHCKAARRKSLV